MMNKVFIIDETGDATSTIAYTYGPYMYPKVLAAGAGKTAKTPANTK